ncbi:MAG: hypothetical protein IJO46_01570, partial [Thermoguttaceae bacterium]|nr:hypothetical protein [Thermoguttaceae bacterium]
RSNKGKEAQIAPYAPQSGGRAAGISKLPPLLPTQKQLIVPPPNYRSGPFGQNVRANGRLVAAAKQATDASELKTPEQLATTSQNSETAQEITTETVRWRAVEPLADVPSPNSASGSTSPIASATNQDSAESVANGQASLIGATAPAKTPILTGATAPKIKTGAAASNSRKFQPVSSQTSAAFDASGVLARLPKAPKGTPQYVLTRRVGDRFEVVSYLEAENGVSLEPYVGRHIGVKGTLGTIQLGENAQKLTTVQTIFARD